MAAARKRVPANVVAVTDNGNITYDQIMGFLAFYTVPDEIQPTEKVRKAWKDAGLDEDLIPEQRSNKDVFQSACRSVEVRREKKGGKQLEVKVDRVMEDSDSVCYQVTRMVRDKANRVIDHPKAMRVTFEKSKSDIRIEPLEPEHYEALRELEKKIRGYYETNLATMPGHKVRNTVREVLTERIQATNVRGKAGGIYFVDKREKGELDKLTNFLERCYGGKAELNTIPMASDDSMRNMVRKHFTVNAIDQLDDMLQRVSHRLRAESGRAVRSDMVANLVEERKRLSESRASYSDLLKDELSELEDKTKLLDAQIMELVARSGD